jgi:hypothetical protein
VTSRRLTRMRWWHVRAADTLSELLAGYLSTPSMPVNGCTTVAGAPGIGFHLTELALEIGSLRSGDYVAYSVRLDLPLPTRLLTIATLSYRLQQVGRVMEKGRVAAVGTFGIDPHLDSPSFVYELNSAAADYADRCLRPKGSGQQLRQVVTYFCGYDLALGGIVMIGRKR